MTWAVEFLGQHFVAFDTAPPVPPAPVGFRWPLDLPASFQDSEKVLEIVAAFAEVTTSSVTANRRVSVSLQNAGGAEMVRHSSATVAASLSRRVEFQRAGADPRAFTGPGTLLLEPWAEGLILLPGHRLEFQLDNRQTGDTIVRVAVRGRVFLP